MSASLEKSQVIVNKSVTIFNVEPPTALVRYLAEVLEWNPTVGLVSRKDPLAASERLLCESIELGRVVGLESNLRVADVGSGAGFPGGVWAVMHRNLDVTLIERREKKALFLERTCRMVGATNVSVAASDLHDVAAQDDMAGAFDLVVTMAVGDPTAIGYDVDRVLKDGGRFASTISRETPAPERIGARLGLEQRHEAKFGCYVIYRCGV